MLLNDIPFPTPGGICLDLGNPMGSGDWINIAKGSSSLIFVGRDSSALEIDGSGYDCFSG